MRALATVGPLRQEGSLAMAGGLLSLALLGVARPQSLAGSLPLWGYVSWTLSRGLAENRDEMQGILFPSLGAPTRITLLRGWLVAVVAGFLRTPAIAAPAYTLAALLDYADGRLARRLGRTTQLGARLDMEVDACGILVMSLAGVLQEKLPPWYVAIGLARYAFVLGLSARRRLEKPVRELDSNRLRRIVAGCQMGFLAVVAWPMVTPEISCPASLLFGAAGLAMFARDWVYATRGADLTGFS